MRHPAKSHSKQKLLADSEHFPRDSAMKAGVAEWVWVFLKVIQKYSLPLTVPKISLHSSPLPKFHQKIKHSKQKGILPKNVNVPNVPSSAKLKASPFTCPGGGKVSTTRASPALTQGELTSVLPGEPSHFFVCESCDGL